MRKWIGYGHCLKRDGMGRKKQLLTRLWKIPTKRAVLAVLMLALGGAVPLASDDRTKVIWA